MRRNRSTVSNQAHNPNDSRIQLSSAVRWQFAYGPERRPAAMCEETNVECRDVVGSKPDLAIAYVLGIDIGCHPFCPPGAHLTLSGVHAWEITDQVMPRVDRDWRWRAFLEFLR